MFSVICHSGLLLFGGEPSNDCSETFKGSCVCVLCGGVFIMSLQNMCTVTQFSDVVAFCVMDLVRRIIRQSTREALFPSVLHRVSLSVFESQEACLHEIIL